jgi:hypothetical protein
MSQATGHGENIACQIQTEDAYGEFDELSNADVWLILDTLHSHMVETRTGPDPIFNILEQAMRELEEIDEELPF